MPLQPRSRVHDGSALDLPPPFRLVKLREVGDAFAHACAHAAELGAGTLVFVGRFDVAEFAVVLEPDEPLASARLAFYAGMVALGDALAALAPPEKPIAIEWPDAIRVDGGLVGGGRLAWPRRADERAAPDWLVFGASIRTIAASGEEPGVDPLATALEDEGFIDAGSGRLVEGFARHLMVALDRWREEDFAAVARDYLSKLGRDSGVRHDIAGNGDLVSRSAGRPAAHRALIPMLARPSWLDADGGAPRR
jgi:biotin-(acetyl-CoA carboxylase) ligase